MMTSIPFVLASTSPSRRSILRQAGVEPLIIPSHVDEDAVVAQLRASSSNANTAASAGVEQPAGEPSEVEVVAALARAKAEAVVEEAAATCGEGPWFILGADSMLFLDGALQGKPKTEATTIQRWKDQRGKSAELITGHALLYQAEGSTPLQTFVEVTRTNIQFADATDEDIAAYAATGEPLQCAGAFTLEAIGGWFIDRIEGDPSNVIGLSLPTLRRGLAQFNTPVSRLWNRTE